MNEPTITIRGVPCGQAHCITGTLYAGEIHTRDVPVTHRFALSNPLYRPPTDLASWHGTGIAPRGREGDDG